MEKVLGFRKKDCCEWSAKQYCEVCRQEEYAVPEAKLVPVVSLAWLEKWCKEKDKYLDNLSKGLSKQYKANTMFGRNQLKDLLSAVRKRAKEGR